jgi:LynF/TruF/PatF family peptide O-prenyltransferase
MNHDHYRTYCKAFEIPQTPLLDSFQEIARIEGCGLECSIKVDDLGVHPRRFNAVFVSNVRAAAAAIVEFLGQVAQMPSAHVDLAAVNGVLQGIDFRRVYGIGCGLDDRGDAHRSRAKIWIGLAGQRDKSRELLAEHDPRSLFAGLMRDDDLPVGVELTFDGRSRIRFYPTFTEAYLASPGLPKGALAEATLELAREATKINVSLDSDDRKVVYFHPKVAERFAARLQNTKADTIHTKCTRIGLRLVAVALNDDEIAKGEYRMVNLYYLGSS